MVLGGHFCLGSLQNAGGGGHGMNWVTLEERCCGQDFRDLRASGQDGSALAYGSDDFRPVGCSAAVVRCLGLEAYPPKNGELV